MSPDTVVHYLAAGSLLLLPGAWIALGARESSLSPAARLALAVVLSPFVAGLQFLAVRAVGVPFESAVWLVVVLNLPALVLLVRAFRTSAHGFDRAAWITGSVVFLLVAGCAAIPWLSDPVFRRFSWHGLAHTDVVYAFANGAIWPEDPELAGVALAYPWLGHAYWAVVGRIVDLSPTVTYVITNLALVAACGMLVYAAARMLGANRPIALGATLLAAVGPNLPGLIGWSVVRPNASGLWWAVAGDMRYTPFLLKFVQFEVMAFGIAAFAALVALVVAAVLYRRPSDAALAAGVTLAVATLYPILFPVAFVLLAAAFSVPYLKPEPPWLEWRRLGRPALVLAVVAVVAVIFLKLYTAGQAREVVRMSSFLAVGKKTVAMALAFSPFLWLGRRAWRATDSRGRAAMGVLFLGTAAGILLHVLLRIGGGLNEYKLVFGAGLCIVVPAAIGLQGFPSLAGRRGYRVPVVGTAVLALAMIAFAAIRIPTAGTTPLAVDESSFWLRLSEDPARTWTDAVREATPPETVVIVREPRFHSTSFTGRTLLVPYDGESPHFGYNMASRYFLLEERGYSRALYDERLDLVERVYSGTEGDAEGVLRALRSIGRPLAIIFKDGAEPSSFRGWLERQGVGRRLGGASDVGTVFYIAGEEGEG